jgi:hypothetical protein
MILEFIRNGHSEIREPHHLEAPYIRAALANWHQRHGMTKRETQGLEMEELIDLALARVDELRLPLRHALLWIRKEGNE